MTLAEAHADLLAEIARHAETTGTTTPCRQSLLWISSKPTVQARAALACEPCPVLALCRTYALDHPHEQGVLGGLVPAGRRALRTTSTAA